MAVGEAHVSTELASAPLKAPHTPRDADRKIPEGDPSSDCPVSHTRKLRHRKGEE